MIKAFNGDINKAIEFLLLNSELIGDGRKEPNFS